jgi:CHAT domain-containing protein
VARLLGVAPLIGDQATIDAVRLRAPTSGLLYFATHGAADEDDPLEGGFLALSPGDSASGRWTAREIQRTPLRARLAVLSACQTGRGREHDAGIIGLARAFTLAGVPRVVMSLWDVDDEVTVELMSAFVQTLKDEPPAEALRRAMLSTRAKHPKVSDWASFVMFGAP